MKMSTSAVRTHTITVAVCSPLLVAQGQMDDDEWIDRYIMLNYEPIIKSMRKPAEVQYKQLCNASFRAMTLPSVEIILLLCFSLRHQSRQAVAEIQKLLKGMDSWRTGTLHDVLSQIRVDLKPNDYEAWRWHFEDTFGVEIDTVMKVRMHSLCGCISSLVNKSSKFIPSCHTISSCYILAGIAEIHPSSVLIVTSTLKFAPF
uniref:Chloride channel CLIC-like protein 1 n=1 Tax=Hucho hucho TaxID=62062 RepID=A0A4W5KAC6_9TELE